MTTPRPKPVVGQTLWRASQVSYRVNPGRAAIYPVIVDSVGRKYFTIKVDGECDDSKFHIDTWRQASIYTPSWHLYATEQEFKDEQRHNELCKQFGSFRPYLAPLEQLEAAAAILWPEKA